MDLKLKQDIEDVVTKIFSAKEEADQKKATQSALNASAEVIDSLTKTLESKTEEMASTVLSLKDEIAEKDSKITTLTSDLEVSSKALEEANKALTVATESLENIKKDQITEVRMAELDEAKVVMTTDKKGQFAKVREMSDVEFAAYKTERVELRNAVMKELEASKASVTAEVVVTPATTVAPAEVVNTPPVNIHPGQAIAAAMNFQTNPSDSMVDKYAELGKAMASTMTTDKFNK